MKKIHLLYYLVIIVSVNAGCGRQKELEELFPYISGQTEDCIGVYGSRSVSREQYERAYKDVLFLLEHMDPRIKKGLLNAKAKLLVVLNEEELKSIADLVSSLLPAEAVFTDLDGVDETIESGYGTGLSTTRLEFMNLVVYYSLLTEPGLLSLYEDLRQAYAEAVKADVFEPGLKYRDGNIDEIHQNASAHDALKIGRYLFCIYSVYYGNGSGGPPDISIHSKVELRNTNPLGYTFIQNYLYLEN